jgi:hypothetical protein
MVSKKAVLVGINDYESINDLRGCLNDVVNMRETLMKYRGFTAQDIRVVVDKRANADNIKHRLEWLVDGAQPGDQLFFHFSGHGSQIRDRNGDELNDHKDEILCLYGMDWDEGYLTDDYFDELFKRIPNGVTFDVFFDCCNSGTGEGVSRSFMGDTNRDLRNRYLEPPLDITLRAEGEKLPTKRLAVASFFSSWFSFLAPTPAPAPMPIPDMGKPDEEEVAIQPEPVSVEEPVVEEKPEPANVNQIVIWSGCGEAQTSADAYISGAYNGAFTYYWCKHMRDSNGNLSRVDLLERVKTSLVSGRYTQIPELTCNEYSSNQKVLF